MSAMNAPSRDAFRDEMLRLAESMRSTGEQLLATLGEERRALADADLAALDDAAVRKSALMDALERLHDEQRTLVRRAPVAQRGDALQRAVDWCDNRGDVEAARRRMREVLARCEGDNRRNGLLLQHRLGFVRRALDALRQAQSDAVTYGPDGDAPARSRLIARG